MNRQRIPVTWQGKFSRSLLANPQPGVIAGLTSRGIFLKLDSNWVLFLSNESSHGPLTLNLPGESPIPKGIAANQEVTIQGEEIKILPVGIEIDFSQAAAWEAPPQAEIWLPAVRRFGSLRTVAGLILSQKNGPGLYLALKDILSFESGDLQPPPADYSGVDWVGLQQLLMTSDLEAIFAALTPFLGLGPGLTPAGDDLILGLLLAFHRWGRALAPAFDVRNLGDRLQRAASQKTTLLSANLIACAAQGQADERLVSSLDGLMVGNLSPGQCARNLLNWGSSSGCDALVGMALAMSLQQLV